VSKRVEHGTGKNRIALAAINYREDDSTYAKGDQQSI
jgi:hypothetical protein